MNETRIEGVQKRWGLDLATIARACGLTVTAVRAWKAGQAQHGDDTLLDEFEDFIAAAHDVGAEDPVSWLEDPLVDGHTVTGWDLYEEAETEALLDIIAGDNPVEVLDDTIRDWRVRFTPRFDRYERDSEVDFLRFAA